MLHNLLHRTRSCHLGLLGDSFTKVSGGESGITFRYHPCGQIRHKVQALQSYDARCHEITGREERVLQIGGHGGFALGDGRKVIHLYAEHNVKEQKNIETNEIKHGSVEMYGQVACEPLCPGAFPLGQ